MQFIRQDTKIDSKSINKLLNTYGKSQVGLNPQAIADDINRLNEEASNSKNKIFKKNCSRLVNYLEGVYNIAVNKGTINLEFKHDGKYIVSNPIEVRKFKYFNIQTVDYFNITNKSVIVLDYSELMNGLALEMGYIDLGYGLGDIEEKLGDVGIVATYAASNLGELLEDNLYYSLYDLRIGDSPYIAPDKRCAYDYFGEKVSDSISYIGMLDSSSRKIMSLVTYDILTKAFNHKLNIELAAVYEDSLVLLVSKEFNAEDISNKLANAVVIRLFGRKFSFKPTITVY